MKLKLLILLIPILFYNIAYAEDIPIYMDNYQIVQDSAPVIIQDRLLAPVMGIFNYAGAKVQWQSGIVYISIGDIYITIKIGDSHIICNGEKIPTDIPAMIINDRTYIPVRVSAECLGYYVKWRQNSNSVYLYKKLSPQERYLSEYEVFILVNQLRMAAGVAPLEWSSVLSHTGRIHAEDMYYRDFYDHTNPDGKTPFDRLKQMNITYLFAAENIARDYIKPEDVVSGWMMSEPHRENILNPSLKKMGVGSFNSFWCQEFTD